MIGLGMGLGFQQHLPSSQLNAFQSQIVATQPSDMIIYLPLDGDLTDLSPNNFGDANSTAISFVLGGVLGTQRASLATPGTSIINTGASSIALFNANNGGVQGTLYGVFEMDWLGVTADNFCTIFSDINNFINSRKTNIANRGLFQHAAGGITRNITYSTLPNSGTVHICQTWDKNVNEYKLFIDGINVTTLGGLGIWTGTVVDIILFSGLLSFLVDNLAIWSIALTPTQISDIYGAA